jgi:hypothetical protein
VDQASKFTLIELLTAKKATLVTKAIQKRMKELSHQTLTTIDDNTKDYPQHQKNQQGFEDKVLFC